jgi:hypothetical protein
VIHAMLAQHEYALQKRYLTMPSQEYGVYHSSFQDRIQSLIEKLEIAKSGDAGIIKEYLNRNYVANCASSKNVCKSNDSL